MNNLKESRLDDLVIGQGMTCSRKTGPGGTLQLCDNAVLWEGRTADETVAAKRFKRVESATAVIWKMLLVAQQRFRRLNVPELMKKIHDGVKYVNGVRVQERAWEAAA